MGTGHVTRGCGRGGEGENERENERENRVRNTFKGSVQVAVCTSLLDGPAPKPTLPSPRLVDTFDEDFVKLDEVLRWMLASRSSRPRIKNSWVKCSIIEAPGSTLPRGSVLRWKPYLNRTKHRSARTNQPQHSHSTATAQSHQS